MLKGRGWRWQSGVSEAETPRGGAGFRAAWPGLTGVTEHCMLHTLHHYTHCTTTHTAHYTHCILHTAPLHTLHHYTLHHYTLHHYTHCMLQHYTHCTLQWQWWCSGVVAHCTTAHTAHYSHSCTSHTPSHSITCKHYCTSKTWGNVLCGAEIHRRKRLENIGVISRNLAAH